MKQNRLVGSIFGYKGDKIRRLKNLVYICVCAFSGMLRRVEC